MAINTSAQKKEPSKRLPRRDPKQYPTDAEQNITELTAIARIKPGMYPKERLEPGMPPEMTWLAHLKAVLEMAHKTRQEAIKKMSTIHYARWVVLENHFLPGIDGPHLLFTSNYDGELDGYLEEFAVVDEGPLNLIFSHCVGWPFARPAKNFLDYVEAHRHPASIFYANYPRATVGEVNRALDWKKKTEKFIQGLEKLHDKPPAQWEAAARKYVNDLAMPTPK